MKELPTLRLSLRYLKIPLELTRIELYSEKELASMAWQELYDYLHMLKGLIRQAKFNLSILRTATAEMRTMKNAILGKKFQNFIERAETGKIQRSHRKRHSFAILVFEEVETKEEAFEVVNALDITIKDIEEYEKTINERLKALNDQVRRVQAKIEHLKHESLVRRF